jgi:hypothetical protein
MQRTVSAGLLGVGWPVLRHAPAILAGMSPGGKKIGSSGSTTAVNGATPVASANSDDTSVVTPAAAQARCDSWSNHRPIAPRWVTVRRKHASALFHRIGSLIGSAGHAPLSISCS